MLGSNPTRDNQVRAEATPPALLDFRQGFFVLSHPGLLLTSHASKNPFIRPALQVVISSKVV